MTTSADSTTAEHSETTQAPNETAPGSTPARPDDDPKASKAAPSAAGARVVERFGAATIAFTVLVAIFGGLFTVLTPPFWGHDEITQFGRAYQVAHGGFLPQEIHDNRGVAYGGEVPTSITALMGYALKDYTTNPDEPDNMVADPGAYDRLGSAAVSEATEPVWFTNTAAYSPVPYIPAAVGIRLAEVFGLDVGGMVALTRLAGLLCYLAVVGFGLYALRKHRVQWLAFTVAVLPIAVFQAGTVTADTMTNALAIMVSALLVKALFLGDRLGRVETGALLAATVLLPVSKPTYVLLAMLVVLVPAERFGFTGRRRALPWVFAALGGIAFAVWMKIAAPTGDGMGLMRPEHQWRSVRPGDQLHGILTDPGHFISVFGESIALRDERWFSQFFGELGFAYIDVPALTMLACLFAFAVSIGIADRMSAATFRRTLLVALTVAASVAMIYVTLYMSFTPVGYYIIDGVQGRYFVPLALVAFAVLLRWMPLRLTDIAGRTPTVGPAVTVIVATVVALIGAVWKYYEIVWG
ncbi:DUF2142 domain-containing protein [Nocardia brasiliensis]|uniref:DUF2142 domain-containing protein n=1 Tax=Nocardia brasiliensis TaxID=37326 RepID=UPI0018951FE4|nr:DUF2142 domain-containing protein [Nocardia brasiliensis]MBF6129112.1 DUF2142 domain-containing protein [Nocardia brasiliensis]MBF6545621.1 DUF2142 domain-containing protein [Nocardia brasiliensis]